MTETKQVIIIRKDLKMRRGKEIAQGSHASMAAVFNGFCKIGPLYFRWFFSWMPITKWLIGKDAKFTKVAVYVNSEEELVDIYNQAVSHNIKAYAIIKDSGKTEFRGVPTFTCCAIGPDYSDKIDAITKHLPLY